MPGNRHLAREKRWRRVLRRVTTPQPVLVLTGRRTQAVRRSPLRRLLPGVTIAVLAAVAGVSGTAWLEAQRRLHNQDAKIEQLRAERDTLAADAAAARDRASRWKGRAQKRQARLAELQPKYEAARRERNALRKRAQGLERTVDQLETEIAHRSQRGAGLARQLRKTNDELARVKDERDRFADRLAKRENQVATLRKRLDKRTARLTKLESRLERRKSQIARLQTRKASLAERASKLEADLEAALKGRDAHLRRWREERQAHKATQADLAQARKARQTAQQRAQRLEDRLADVSARTAKLVARLETLTAQRSKAVKAALGIVDANLPQLARNVDPGGHLPGGKGGPLKPAEALKGGAGTDPPQSLVKLHKRLAGFRDRTEQLGRLQGLVKRLPLARPVDHYWVSSDYGMRQDPFTGERAMHEGLDMAGLANRPVYAAAAGKVVSAGWHGGYGRQVVIDHGLGIKTRYAHLAGYEVEAGERVGLRERIGRLGSSGRSKDTHLHYEVQIDDQRLDPTKFIQAGSEICPL